MADPIQLANRKYKNVLQTAFLIVKEEGVGALYKGGYSRERRIFGGTVPWRFFSPIISSCGLPTTITTTTTTTTTAGVLPTILRQGCNQAVNFTFYDLFKKKLMLYRERVGAY